MRADVHSGLISLNVSRQMEYHLTLPADRLLAVEWTGAIEYEFAFQLRVLEEVCWHFDTSNTGRLPVLVTYSCGRYFMADINNSPLKQQRPVDGFLCVVLFRGTIQPRFLSGPSYVLSRSTILITERLLAGTVWFYINNMKNNGCIAIHSQFMAFHRYWYLPVGMPTSFTHTLLSVPLLDPSVYSSSYSDEWFDQCPNRKHR